MTTRPIVFAYHDYRDFIKDMMEFLKTTGNKITSRTLSKALGVTSGYFSMIINKKRDITPELTFKLAGLLGLGPNEMNFFELLVRFNSTKSDILKAQFLDRMKHFKKYKELNKEEAIIHDYFSNWLNIAIREMSALSDFNDDAKWIQKRLKYPASLQEIKKSLKFLMQNKIIKKEESYFVKPDYQISCTDKVFSNALAQFHREFLQLAGDSIIKSNAQERLLLGHCTALSKENYTKANQILSEAFEKIRNLQTHTDESESVYFTELTLFPLTEGE